MAYDRQGVFSAVHRLLAENPRISLTAISERLGIERHTIEIIVREAQGVSFREYQQAILLTRAIRLLTCKSNLSVKEISVTLGYDWPRDFSRFIKTATGLTPTELRRKRQLASIEKANSRIL